MPFHLSYCLLEGRNPSFPSGAAEFHAFLQNSAFNKTFPKDVFWCLISPPLELPLSWSRAACSACYDAVGFLPCFHPTLLRIAPRPARASHPCSKPDCGTATLFSKGVFKKQHFSKIFILSVWELPKPEVIAQALNVILVALEHSQYLDSTKGKNEQPEHCLHMAQAERAHCLSSVFRDAPWWGLYLR